jgi:hypothetical protein
VDLGSSLFLPGREMYCKFKLVAQGILNVPVFQRRFVVSLLLDKCEQIYVVFNKVMDFHVPSHRHLHEDFPVS